MFYIDFWKTSEFIVFVSAKWTMITQEQSPSNSFFTYSSPPRWCSILIDGSRLEFIIPVPTKGLPKRVQNTWLHTKHANWCLLIIMDCFTITERKTNIFLSLMFKTGLIHVFQFTSHSTERLVGYYKSYFKLFPIGEVEDEFHFLIQCPLYTDERKQLYEK